MRQEIPMRRVFGETLCGLAAEYPHLVVLDTDCSSSTQTGLFGDRYPERFYNFGIAEANMVGAAAGMAACGLMPVASTFAFLMTLRAGDQVRSLVAYNRLNVKLAAGYAGLSDHADGASHQSVMDLAVVRSMPNMTVLVPSDVETTRGAVRSMLDHIGPVYLRLSRAPVASLHAGDETFNVGKGKILREGSDVTIVFCGTVIDAVLEAAEQLQQEGIASTVLELGTLKPLDSETLIALARKTGAVVTVEEHTIYGGLGGAVAECLAEECPVPLKRVGIRDTFGESGPYNLLLKRYGLSSADVLGAVRTTLALKK